MTEPSTPPQNSVGPSTCSVIIRADAQDAMDRHMSDDTAIEYGGVLVGTADPLIGLVIVTAHEPLPDSDSAETVTFTRETWDQMTRVVMARHPGQRIVGWYHSHPRFGIFLSAHDLAIQTTYFSQPWQVAYVFDPVQHERGLFGWSNYEIVRIPEWEVATATPGILTSAPAHVPAHGEYLTARLADEVFAASATSAASAELVSNPAATVAGPPVFSAPAAASAPTANGRPATANGPSRVKWAVLAVVALVAGAAVAFLFTRGDDSSNTSTTTESVTSPSVAVTTPVESSTTAAPSTEVSTAVTEAPTTTVDSAVTSSAPETSAPAAPVVTPAVVTAPAARVGAGAQACDATSNGGYAPAANCFVALNNGNVLSYADGQLTCADPAGSGSIGNAASFTVGVGDDPLVVLADDRLVPKCGDVTYAKNILAGGATTLDGLCGSSGTAIDDASLRCFSQNPTTGAMAALVTGSNGSIAASCSNGSPAPTVATLTWTKGIVDVSWRIVSLRYDSDQQLFEASATRNGVPSKATFVCA